MSVSRHREILNIGAKKPVIGEVTFIAPCANVIGDVQVGKNSGVWYGAILKGDLSKIRIGENSMIKDRAVLSSGVAGSSISIGNNVVIGQGAVIGAATIEDNATIGMGSTVADGAVVKKGAFVAPGSVVDAKTTVPSGQVLPGFIVLFANRTIRLIFFSYQSVLRPVYLKLSGVCRFSPGLRPSFCAI
jgi:carbonic anhydrase/acetyltransferase-like protein (isoleucine patch superfamily)